MHPAITQARRRRKEEEVSLIRDKCRTLLKGSGVKLYLFGSYARDSFSSFSDIDVLITTSSNDDIPAARACASKLAGDTLIIDASELPKKAQRTNFWANINRDKELIL